jgi:uncharacterized protein with PQ loop repeat
MDLETLTGWLASALLFITVGSQVWKQIREERCDGVSRFLFLGQFMASALFLAYSVMGGNTVFIVSNAFMLAAALVGQGVLLRNRRRQARREAAGR